MMYQLKDRPGVSEQIEQWFGFIPTWLWAILVVLGLVIPSLKSLVELFNAARPFFPSPEQRAIAGRKRAFAKTLVSDLRLLNEQETWEDDLYTELEVEV